MNFQKTKIHHLAIILDGNGRWAEQQGLHRSDGHKAGVERLKDLLPLLEKYNIPIVSLYIFSKENWKRPKREIENIWQLSYEFIDSYLPECKKYNIELMTSGDITALPEKLQKKIKNAVSTYSKKSKHIINLCINYGAQDEIIRACNLIIKDRMHLAEQNKWKDAKKEIDKKIFEKSLYTHALAPVDLLIRSGGESRISNFLLWQCAYAEFFITEKLWPDFSEKELEEAINWFNNRNRRFGNI